MTETTASTPIPLRAVTVGALAGIVAALVALFGPMLLVETARTGLVFLPFVVLLYAPAVFVLPYTAALVAASVSVRGWQLGPRAAFALVIGLAIAGWYAFNPAFISPLLPLAPIIVAAVVAGVLAARSEARPGSVL